MKKTLFLITLLVCVCCFSACSDDEGGFELSQIEGTWGLTALSGYYNEDGEKESFNEKFNPSEPTQDDEKIVIQKLDDNRYQMINYTYSNNSWHSYDSGIFSVDGKRIIPEDMSQVDYSDIKFLEATASKLVIETKDADEYGSSYQKLTYKRMAE